MLTRIEDNTGESEYKLNKSKKIGIHYIPEQGMSEEEKNKIFNDNLNWYYDKIERKIVISSIIALVILLILAFL